MGGYSQGWPSPAYAPVTYSGAGYSAASGQMASYAPMSAGYAMPVVSYHLYTAATPMTYGTPGTMTYGTPGTSTYSSAYGRPASGIYPNAAPGQMAPGSTFQGPASTYQPGSINQGMNKTCLTALQGCRARIRRSVHQRPRQFQRPRCRGRIRDLARDGLGIHALTLKISRMRQERVGACSDPLLLATW